MDFNQGHLKRLLGLFYDPGQKTDNNVNYSSGKEIIH